MALLACFRFSSPSEAMQRTIDGDFSRRSTWTTNLGLWISVISGFYFSGYFLNIFFMLYNFIFILLIYWLGNKSEFLSPFYLRPIRQQSLIISFNLLFFLNKSNFPSIGASLWRDCRVEWASPLKWSIISQLIANK